MTTHPRISLQAYNSFAVKAWADHLLVLDDKAKLAEVIEVYQRPAPALILGGGSNVLFVGDFQGTVIVNRLQDIKRLKENDGWVFVEAAAGVNWHDFVRWSLSKRYYGLENLSLIPGTVGAAPVQNIGAYGVELDQFVEAVNVIDLTSGQVRQLDPTACQFAYRNSIFKQSLDRYLITSVLFKLSKHNRPKLDYAGIKEQLVAMGIAPKEASAIQVSDAICSIRQQKLPDFSVLGNAGSFFKNPVIDEQKFAQLQRSHPQIKAFRVGGDAIKLAAAWMIEYCGWKGHRSGDAAVSANHALILVNYGSASGAEIWRLAQAIISSVYDEFGVSLEPEPRIIA